MAHREVPSQRRTLSRLQARTMSYEQAIHCPVARLIMKRSIRWAMTRPNFLQDVSTARVQPHVNGNSWLPPWMMPHVNGNSWMPPWMMPHVMHMPEARPQGANHQEASPPLPERPVFPAAAPHRRRGRQHRELTQGRTAARYDSGRPTSSRSRGRVRPGAVSGQTPAPVLMRVTVSRTEGSVDPSTLIFRRLPVSRREETDRPVSNSPQYVVRFSNGTDSDTAQP